MRIWRDCEVVFRAENGNLITALFDAYPDYDEIHLTGVMVGRKVKLPKSEESRSKLLSYIESKTNIFQQLKPTTYD